MRKGKINNFLAENRTASLIYMEIGMFSTGIFTSRTLQVADFFTNAVARIQLSNI